MTKTSLFKYTENFTTKKKWKFSDKKSDIFHISAKNISKLGEAVLTSTHNLCFWAEIKTIMYIPVYSSFTILKFGYKGVKLIQACFRDGTTISKQLEISLHILILISDCNRIKHPNSVWKHYPVEMSFRPSSYCHNKFFIKKIYGFLPFIDLYSVKIKCLLFRPDSFTWYSFRILWLENNQSLSM